MKKQFFYAAMALAMLSSCSKDNDLVAPDPTPDVIDDTTPAMIQLGINTPTVVTTRGTGSVGDLATEAQNNKWNKQALAIYMFPKNKIETFTSPISSLSFQAPTSDATDNKVTITDGTVPYYPMQGSFDFYGYHMDTETDNANPVATVTNNTLVANGTIDGTNDVMAAIAQLSLEDQAKLLNKFYNSTNYVVSSDGKSVVNGSTPLTDQEKADLAKESEKAFSSYAARRDIQPNLIFKHVLTRLKFNVKAGEDKAAQDYYTGANAVPSHKLPNTTFTEEQLGKLNQGEIIDLDADVNGTETTDGAVYIQEIKVINQQDGVTLTFTPGTAAVIAADGTSVTTPAVAPKCEATFSAATADAAFTLMGRDTNWKTALAGATSLIPTAPEAYDAASPSATAVGESMMITPKQETFTVEIIVMQYVITKKGATESEDEYKWKVSKLKSTVKAPTKMPDPEKADQKIESTDKTEEGAYYFAAGKSYNINITVYGYQKIEINAELTGWIAGDDVDVNPEDDAFNKNN